MSGILEYKNNGSAVENLSIKRLRDFPIYHEDFVTFVTNSIKGNYDEIDETFAKRLIEIDKKGFDEYGFFTLGKDIWICFYNDVPVGFEVITRKRGGSIKLGPTYLLPEYRGKGFAKEMIEQICDEYVKNGTRKVYVTAPISNYSTAVLDYSKLNLKLEAILCKNYSKNSSDRVCGKIFYTKDNNESITVRIKQGTNLIKQVTKNILSEINFEKLNDFVCKNMEPYFNDIDRTFTKTIIEASCEENKLMYEHKCKDSFIALENNEIKCLVVATPKRGRNYKVSPFLVKETGINSGLMIAQYTAASLVSENKVLSHPASVDSIPSSANQEDHVSMGSISSRKALEIKNHLSRILSIELLCASQAIDLKENLKLGDGTSVIYEMIRNIVDFIDKDRFFYEDINNIEKLINDESFINRIENVIGKIEF